MTPENENCSQSLGICPKGVLGRMVLPAGSCSCSEGFGRDRVSLPPVLWWAMSLSLGGYATLKNYHAAESILETVGWPGFFHWLAGDSTMIPPLLLLSALAAVGGLWEFRMRQGNGSDSEKTSGPVSAIEAAGPSDAVYGNNQSTS